MQIPHGRCFSTLSSRHRRRRRVSTSGGRRRRDGSHINPPSPPSSPRRQACTSSSRFLCAQAASLPPYLPREEEGEDRISTKLRWPPLPLFAERGREKAGGDLLCSPPRETGFAGRRRRRRRRRRPTERPAADAAALPPPRMPRPTSSAAHRPPCFLPLGGGGNGDNTREREPLSPSLFLAASHANNRSLVGGGRKRDVAR